MKRIIRFQRTRYYFFALSALLFAAGITGYLVNGGFNRGVDFRSGLALQFQIAPASFTIRYVGTGSATIDIPAGEQALTAAGDVILSVTAPDGTTTNTPLRWADYPTVEALAEALGKIPGVVTEISGEAGADPKRLVPLVRPATLGEAPFTLNLMPEPGRGVQARIADVRATLDGVGKHDLQVVGAAENQEFIARFEAPTDEPEFQTTVEAKVLAALREAYGADQVILKRTDFVGPRLAQSLGSQAVWLVVIALLAIMAYMILRFRFVYSMAAVLALVHDAAIVLAFAAIFRVEIDANTIAAILTILGYSINDTIVIFDRVRENQTLMRESSLETILDASVTQTLSRTFITSGATMMAVLALYLFTSGSMKNFALLMIVGIIEGTYSTVFIASPIVLEWENAMTSRRRRRELEKYGIRGHEKPAPVEEPELEEETDVEEALVAPATSGAPYSAATAIEPAAAASSAPAAAAPAAGMPGATTAGAAAAGVARDQSHHHHRRRRRHH